MQMSDSAETSIPEREQNVPQLSTDVTDSTDSESSSSVNSAQLSSYEVFMKFVQKDEEDVVNVDKVFSKKSYQMWLNSRSKTPKQPKESFRRALTSHVRGTDQRKPFPEDIEEALLVKLRQKKSWECFSNLGRYGFRGLGYHESNRIAEEKRQRKKLKKRKQKERRMMEAEMYGRYYLPYSYPSYSYPQAKRTKFSPELVQGQMNPYPYYQGMPYTVPYPMYVPPVYDNITPIAPQQMNSHGYSGGYDQ